MAPLTEDDYSQADDHSDFSVNQIKKSGLNLEDSSKGKIQHDQSRSRSSSKSSKSLDDVPLHLNLPLGSDGQGSHDSHNDSGYSTRLGFSAGPSPSLSGLFNIFKFLMIFLNFPNFFKRDLLWSFISAYADNP